MTISDFVAALGGTNATARAFTTTPQAVCNWKRRRRLPAARQLQALHIARRHQLIVDVVALAGFRK
jgi:hypothetical protein